MKLAFSLTAIIISALIISTNAQITFSRDWFAGSGKRSALPPMVQKPFIGARDVDFEMERPAYAHVSHAQSRYGIPSGFKRDYRSQGLGLPSGNHKQDLIMAIQYLQNMKQAIPSDAVDGSAEEMLVEPNQPASNTKENSNQLFPGTWIQI